MGEEVIEKVVVKKHFFSLVLLLTLVASLYGELQDPTTLKTRGKLPNLLLQALDQDRIIQCHFSFLPRPLLLLSPLPTPPSDTHLQLGRRRTERRGVTATPT